jgi:hypothetical protein
LLTVAQSGLPDDRPASAPFVNVGIEKPSPATTGGTS